jgi:hypothetical protein
MNAKPVCITDNAFWEILLKTETTEISVLYIQII